MKKLGSVMLKMVILAAVVFGTAQLCAVSEGVRFADAALFSTACGGVTLTAYALNLQLERAIAAERRRALRRAAVRQLSAAAAAPRPLRPAQSGRVA